MITKRSILGYAATAIAAMALDGNVKASDGRGNKTVFLTSDDGPEAGTSTIIDIAERHQVPVTLFMIGMNVAANKTCRSLLERARNSAWITIGNHSFNHCSEHYVRCYHDPKSLVSDFERANRELGFAARPVLARAPGRNVWRLPGMRIDDAGISHREMRIEDAAHDALFAADFYLHGWDVEWPHDARGLPIGSSRRIVDRLTGSAARTRRPGKAVMLMHDVMMRTTRGASELTRIIEGVRDRGCTFGRLSDY
jgi:peptidoglycan/xylan/chitin deacetylase (PgdA/CDA1 family)